MALNKGFFEIEYQKIEINEKIGLGNLTVRRSHYEQNGIILLVFSPEKAIFFDNSSRPEYHVAPCLIHL